MAEFEKPEGKEYAGPSGIGRDSNWLTAEDLIEGRDVTVEIEKVVLYDRVKFQGGRTRTNMIGLEFKGKERVLGLNATNRKVLNAMFGNLTGPWKGKSITLYVAETQMAGETVKCVRIRKQGSRVATAAEEFLHEEDEPRTGNGEGHGTNGGAQPVLPITEAAALLVGKLDEACRAMGITAKERERLMNKHQRNVQAALDELNERANSAA